MNSCTFVGRLGRDVEVKNLPSGTTVAEFAVAVDTGYGDRKATLWLRCKLWGKRAEGGLIQYLVKGKQVVVSGALSESAWTASDGAEKKTLELDIADIALVGGGEGQQQDNSFAPAQQPAPPVQQPTAPVVDLNVDIPF